MLTMSPILNLFLLSWAENFFDFVTKSKKFSAHDSKNKFNIGDVVNIRECTPISKNKRFEVIY